MDRSKFSPRALPPLNTHGMDPQRPASSGYLIDTIKQEDFVRHLLRHWFQRAMEARLNNLRKSFDHIKNIWHEEKQIHYASKIKALVNELQSITLSTKGSRSYKDRKLIRDVILGPKETHEIFHKLRENEIDQLCQYIDCSYNNNDLNILFLQGHPGNESFFIAHGRVELYFEDNREREVQIRQRLGSNYGNITNITNEQLGALGVNIKTLTQGSLFGDLAAISKTTAIRSCAAVTVPDTLLLVIDVDTYNAILRQFRVSESQLTIASQLLKESLLFSHYTDGKMKNIAYNMHCKTLQPKTTVARAGEPVNMIYIVLSGDVKMYPYESLPPNTNVHPTVRMSRVAIAQLGRGTIIGEKEMLKKLTVFQMTYVTCNNCQIFEMDARIFEMYACSEKMRVAHLFKHVEEKEQLIEDIHMHRLAANRVVLGEIAARSSIELQLQQQQQHFSTSTSSSILHNNNFEGHSSSTSTSTRIDELRSPRRKQSKRHNQHHIHHNSHHSHGHDVITTIVPIKLKKHYYDHNLVADKGYGGYNGSNSNGSDDTSVSSISNGYNNNTRVGNGGGGGVLSHHSKHDAVNVKYGNNNNGYSNSSTNSTTKGILRREKQSNNNNNINDSKYDNSSNNRSYRRRSLTSTSTSNSTSSVLHSGSDPTSPVSGNHYHNTSSDSPGGTIGTSMPVYTGYIPTLPLIHNHYNHMSLLGPITLSK
eukprot:gene1044-2043_t